MDAAWDLTKRKPSLQRLNSYKYELRPHKTGLQQVESYFTSACLIDLNSKPPLHCTSLEHRRSYKKKISFPFIPHFAIGDCRLLYVVSLLLSRIILSSVQIFRQNHPSWTTAYSIDRVSSRAAWLTGEKKLKKAGT